MEDGIDVNATIFGQIEEMLVGLSPAEQAAKLLAMFPPTDPMKALFDRASKSIEDKKYDPDQPRVPEGNGDISGQWVSEDAPVAPGSGVSALMAMMKVGVELCDDDMKKDKSIKGIRARTQEEKDEFLMGIHDEVLRLSDAGVDLTGVRFGTGNVPRNKMWEDAMGITMEKVPGGPGIILRDQLAIEVRLARGEPFRERALFAMMQGLAFDGMKLPGFLAAHEDGYAGVVRHEIGHAIGRLHENEYGYRGLIRAAQLEYKTKFDSLAEANAAMRKDAMKVSLYGAAGGIVELYAESFAKYHSPTYKQGDLPKWIEDAMKATVTKPRRSTR